MLCLRLRAELELLGLSVKGAEALGCRACQGKQGELERGLQPHLQEPCHHGDGSLLGTTLLHLRASASLNATAFLHSTTLIGTNMRTVACKAPPSLSDTPERLG